MEMPLVELAYFPDPPAGFNGSHLSREGKERERKGEVELREKRGEL